MGSTRLGIRVGELEVSAARATSRGWELLSSPVEAPGPSRGQPFAAQARALREVLEDVLSEAEGATEVVLDIGDVLSSILRDPSTPLGRVTSVRISPSERSIRSPLAGWPSSLTERLDAGHFHIPGGTDLHGEQPVPLDETLLEEVLAGSRAHRADAFAVAAVGALLDERTELAAADTLAGRSGLSVSLSHQISGLRFMEREASTILNAAMLRPACEAFDVLQSTVHDVAPSARQSFLLADGSRLGREEARSFPIRAVGTRAAALAQGAAALSGVGDAIVVVWAPERTDLMIFESGCLRAEPLRQLPALLPGVQLSQRHASRVALPSDMLTDAIAPDLLRSDLELVLVESTFARTGTTEPDRVAQDFGALAATLQKRFPAMHVVDQRSAEVAALGALVSHPQSEVLRFAVASKPSDLESVRHRTRTIAQSRVLATDPRAVLRAVADTVAPLSFLESGPVLLRVHVDGTDREES